MIDEPPYFRQHQIQNYRNQEHNRNAVFSEHVLNDLRKIEKISGTCVKPSPILNDNAAIIIFLCENRILQSSANRL